MSAFFLFAGKNKGYRSEVSGVPISSIGKINLHHTWAKASYPEVMYSISGLLLVTSREHEMIENDWKCFQENIDRKKWVEDNWEFCVEESQKWSEDYDELKRKEEDE